VYSLRVSEVSPVQSHPYTAVRAGSVPAEHNKSLQLLMHSAEAARTADGTRATSVFSVEDGAVKSRDRIRSSRDRSAENVLSASIGKCAIIIMETAASERRNGKKGRWLFVCRE